MISIFLQQRVVSRIKKAPWHGWPVTLQGSIIFAALALPLAWGAGLLEPGFIGWPYAVILPLTLLVFPSLLEEVFFRGLLLPRGESLVSRSQTFRVVGLNAALFTAWHPLNALTINRGAEALFLDPVFLGIVFILGVICGMTVLRTGNLWAAILLHWFTVLIWVVFLGGRNLVLT